MTVLRSGSATDVGRVRKINQDLPVEATNLYAVADGMGGHVGGEVAAQVAVDALLRVFASEPTRDGLENAFSRANQAVWQEGQDHSELRGMGTTLTAVALVGGADGRDTLALANVGDSRAYLFSEGRIIQVTSDHSLAEERMRHGEMTEEEAAVHPQRHILTRALGVSHEVEADMWELQLRAGDRLILCSDGLSNELSSDEMAEILAIVPDPGEAARELVETANAHGGSDNITVVVVDVLVGEKIAAGGSVITPVGERAGAPLIVTPGSTPGSSGGAGVTGVLANGADLGLTGQVAVVGGAGVRSGEFDFTQAVPVARSTDRSTVSAPRPADAPPNESRGDRRRRLGIPRRITFRVALFVVLVAAVPTGAYFAIRWYAYDNWFLSLQGKQIVVKQGHPGGVLWFAPRIVDHTGTTTSDVLSTGVAQIRAGVQEPSLHAAKKYVENLKNARTTLEAQKKARDQGSGTTTTTVPIAGTTTVPVTSVAPAGTTANAVATTSTVASTATVAPASTAATPAPATPATATAATVTSTTATP